MKRRGKGVDPQVERGGNDEGVETLGWQGGGRYALKEMNDRERKKC